MRPEVRMLKNIVKICFDGLERVPIDLLQGFARKLDYPRCFPIRNQTPHALPLRAAFGTGSW